MSNFFMMSGSDSCGELVRVGARDLITGTTQIVLENDVWEHLEDLVSAELYGGDMHEPREGCAHEILIRRYYGVGIAYIYFLYDHQRGRCELHGIHVDSHFRGRGVARSLMRAVVEFGERLWLWDYRLIIGTPANPERVGLAKSYIKLRQKFSPPSVLNVMPETYDKDSK